MTAIALAARPLAPQAPPKVGRWRSRWDGRAAKVRRDLRVLAKHRLLSGRMEVDDQWARATSDALVFTLCGSTLDSMNEMMRRCGLVCDEAVAIDAINDTKAIIKRKGRATYRLISNRVRGEMLNVTLEEAIAIRLTTMTPVDERPDQALQRHRLQRRDYNRDYGRIRRAKAGAVSHVQSASRTKPWGLLGWSRAKWYRRGKPKACEAHDIVPVQREHTRKAVERMRRAKGAPPRAARLEHAWSRTPPWEADGISRSTWEQQRRKQRANAPSPSAALRQIRQVAILVGSLPREGLKGSTSSFLTFNEFSNF